MFSHDTPVARPKPGPSAAVTTLHGKETWIAHKDRLVFKNSTPGREKTEEIHYHHISSTNQELLREWRERRPRKRQALAGLLLLTAGTVFGTSAIYAPLNALFNLFQGAVTRINPADAAIVPSLVTGGGAMLALAGLFLGLTGALRRSTIREWRLEVRTLLKTWEGRSRDHEVHGLMNEIRYNTYKHRPH